jgi:beta-ureidopropionase
LAFNGAEIVYRPSEAMPMTGSSYPGGGSWMVQNRAHSEFNSLYMVCPNIGPVRLSPSSPAPVDIAGGNGHIVDYRGNVMSYSASGNNTMTAAIIDVEALRQFRAMNLNSNWLKDLRTELFAEMYRRTIHPKNLWIENEPAGHADVDEVYRANIERLYEAGTWTPPAIRFPGAKYIAPMPIDRLDAWREAEAMWEPWN